MTAPLFIRVACPADYCPAFGTPRRVRLRFAAIGVVELPRLLCQACRSVVQEIQEDNDMPKTSRTGGPTNAAAEPGEVGYMAEPNSEPEEGEQSSPGKNSRPSSAKPVTSPTPKLAGSQQPARTTGSRSGKGRAGSSTARGTAGDPDNA